MARKKESPKSQASSAASGPTATAPKDPQPSVDRIEELARRILTGDILLPKFQREFIWDPQQILDLLDSIARNYPIGSVLLWQSRQELRNENRIADLEIKLPKPDYPVNYLLDGQQRLSTICGALYWNGKDPNSRWNIAYDLREQVFNQLDSLADPPLHQIRMNKIQDPAAFFKHVSSLDTLSAPDKDILKSNAEKLFNRFKDYKIATVTLGDMSIQDVAPIFERINSTGTPLTIVDLMRAATWSQEFDLIDCIEEMLTELSEKGFGGLDRKAFLRNMSAAAGGGFSTSSIDDLRKHPPEKLKEVTATTTEAYKRTVDFLSTQIKVPGDAVVPYANQIVVLAEIFRLVPNPSSFQYQEIRKWFWKTAASGYFSGWNTGMMAADLQAVRKFALGESNTIEVSAEQPRLDIWINRGFRSNTAHTKVLAIVLSHLKPIDLLTGQEIDVAKALAWTNIKEFHHFSPKKFLRQQNVPQNRINGLANMIMLTSQSNKAILDRAPSEYLLDVSEAAGANLERWLGTHLITREAYEAARKDDFASFLNLRAQAIHSTVLALADW